MSSSREIKHDLGSIREVQSTRRAGMWLPTKETVAGKILIGLATTIIILGVCAAVVAPVISAINNGNSRNTNISTGTPITYTTTTATTATTTSATTATTTTATTSTTTTSLFCSTACINTTTSTSSSLLALYLFDSNVNDYTASYSGTAVGSPSYVVGYVGNAINLVASSTQSVTLPLALALNNRSSTVELWLRLQSPLYATSTATDVSIISQCSVVGLVDGCLYYNIRSDVLHQGFFNDDKAGTTNISTLLGQWVHVAFTYDLTTRLRQIYINGIAEPTGYTIGLTSALEGGPYIGTNASATIGRNTLLNAPLNHLNAYVDHFSIGNRAKSACEILNDATLVAYFPFDSGSLIDVGPNMISATATGQTTITGQRNQALSFTGNGATSYFQMNGLTALGTSNSAFSIGLYINPTVLYGSIVHVSMFASGTSGWCLPFIGFTTSQELAVQVWNSTFAVYALGPILTINTWTHVVETFSLTNGLRLYVNGTLYASVPGISTYLASGVQNYLTVASTLTASIQTTFCTSTGVLRLGSYNGAVDELRVYNRELTAEESCTLSRS